MHSCVGIEINKNDNNIIIHIVNILQICNVKNINAAQMFYLNKKKKVIFIFFIYNLISWNILGVDS